MKELTTFLKEWSDAYKNLSLAMDEFSSIYKQINDISICLKEETDKIEKFLSDYEWFEYRSKNNLLNTRQ